jgi:acyl carrier protein
VNRLEIAATLERFLRDSFYIAADDPGFGRSIDLFECGYVDSVGVIETLAFISQTYRVEIPDEALLSESFATIDGIVDVVAMLLSALEKPARVG